MTGTSDQAPPVTALATARAAFDDAARQERLARAELEAAMVAAAGEGLSQSQIATLAGVSQPYVSQVLARCRGRFVPRSRLGVVLAAHRREVLAAADRHHVTGIKVFGSVARGEDGNASDIDLAIDLPDTMGLLGLARLEVELEAILGVDVDLVPSEMLIDAARSTATHDAVPL